MFDEHIILLLMAEILHSWKIVYPIFLQGLYIPGGAGFQPSTVGPIVSNFVHFSLWFWGWNLEIQHVTDTVEIAIDFYIWHPRQRLLVNIEVLQISEVHVWNFMRVDRNTVIFALESATWQISQKFAMNWQTV